MANYVSKFKTNRVHLDATMEFIAQLAGAAGVKHDSNEQGTMFYGETTSFSITYDDMEKEFPLIVDHVDNQAHNADEDARYEHLDLDLTDELYPLLKGDDILQIMEVGSEKHRYLIGYCAYYNQKGYIDGVNIDTPPDTIDTNNLKTTA